jgi:NADH dehydrogenase [ubiquinone] 1 alpha subcomplex assembly factor 7
MSALEDYLRDLIVQDGPLTLERYMGLALGHPTMGYYTTRDPFGAAGDFTTAPEISQMFGELIGLWAAETWVAMGAPPRLHLVEIGPGRGTLMQDALRAASVAPAFARVIEAHLVETSPVLAKAQRETLAGASAPVSWHSAIETIPPGPAIVLANEFFDALPVRHYVSHAGAWRERLVGLDAQNRFTFGLSREVEPSIKVAAPQGSVIEISAVGQRIMTTLAARLVEQGGAALIIDYGYVETALGETLQALRGHRFVDPLDCPGEADLTTHVDFAALARAARAAGAQVYGPVTQGALLTGLGIFERARALSRRADAAQVATIEAALLRLVSGQAGMEVEGGVVDGMGELFKAICVTAPGMATPAGFEAQP